MEENCNNSFPKNAMYGHCYVMNQRFKSTYTPEEGLIKGTIFPELYSPYSAGDSFREIAYLKNYGTGGTNNNE